MAAGAAPDRDARRRGVDEPGRRRLGAGRASSTTGSRPRSRRSCSQTAGRLFGRFGEAPQLREALERAGFSDVTVETKHADLTFESAEAWWEWTWAGGFRAFLEAMPEDAQERYREAAFDRLAAGGLTRRFVALLARARR